MPDTLGRLTDALAGRYRIERELGQGGMAMVYLANDLKHDRAVALKVLRPELAAILGGERFLQEIKVTAKLQHPHILTLHDSGEADGLLFYVMPFIEGESLRDRLTRERQLSVDDAVRIATQVASALDYAHRHNVIHRDIKPENILLEDGQAMVADFGIALAVRAAGGTRLTETGLSLGTPHYMSPEQATADRELDARSDIYSLACVVYEMLAGEPPYTGPSAQAVITKILTEEPKVLTEVRRTVPAHLAAAVAQALEKLPADRFTSAAQFADALTGAAPVARASAAALPALPAPSRALRKLRTLLPWAVAAASVGGFVWQVVGSPETESPNTIRLELRGVQFNYGPTGRNIAVSPDGKYVVYQGSKIGQDPQLYLRALDKLEDRPLSGTSGATQPFFSWDGAWLGFLLDGKLRKTTITGGPSTVITEAPGAVRGISWGVDDRIVFATGSGSGLAWVSASGGTPATLTRPDSAAGELEHRWPHVLPDGGTVLFTVWRGGVATAEIAVVSMKTGAIRAVGAGVSPQYAGGLLFTALSEMSGGGTAASGALLAVPFRPDQGRVVGASVTILEGPMVKTGGAAEYAVGSDGTLAYYPGAFQNEYVALVDRRGVERRLRDVGHYHDARVSPDGKRVAVVAGGRASHDVWILDLERPAFMRLSFEPVDDATGSTALWTPDGRRVLFVSLGRASVLSRSADGTGGPDTLLRADYGQLRGWLKNGKALLMERGGFAGVDIWTIELETGSATALIATSFAETGAAASPDERWVAYASNETGRFEVYVAGVGTSRGRLQVSTGGGTNPVWARDGRTLFFRSPRALMAAKIALTPSLQAGEPAVIFPDSTTTAFDVLPDGQHFVVVRRGALPTDANLIVVHNWLAEVWQLLGQPR